MSSVDETIKFGEEFNMRTSFIVVASAALIGSLFSSPALAQKSKRFSTELEAQAYCQSNAVVWADRNTKVFHISRSARYGLGKRGAYMCQNEALKSGYREAKTAKATAF
jgi:hypothetical protein